MSRTHILVGWNHLQRLRNNLLAVRMTCKTLEGWDNGGEGGGGIIHHEIVQHVHSAVCDIVTFANGDIPFSETTNTYTHSNWCVWILQCCTQTCGGQSPFQRYILHTSNLSSGLLTFHIIVFFFLLWFFAEFNLSLLGRMGIHSWLGPLRFVVILAGLPPPGWGRLDSTLGGHWFGILTLQVCDLQLGTALQRGGWMDGLIDMEGL